jgi:hypothetical protein
MGICSFRHPQPIPIEATTLKFFIPTGVEGPAVPPSEAATLNGSAALTLPAVFPSLSDPYKSTRATAVYLLAGNDPVFGYPTLVLWRKHNHHGYLPPTRSLGHTAKDQRAEGGVRRALLLSSCCYLLTTPPFLWGASARGDRRERGQPHHPGRRSGEIHRCL